MATTKQWMRFFLDAGIPPDSAAHYAVTFEQNRMGLDMVGDLDKEDLSRRWTRGGGGGLGTDGGQGQDQENIFL